MRRTVQYTALVRRLPGNCATVAVFRYTARDPLAVTVDLGWGADDRPLASYRFGRDLLRFGMAKPVGLGLVEVWPHGGRIALRLTSPKGTYVVTVRHRDLCKFLDETYNEVPPGHEHRYLHLDAELDRLLTGGEVR